jgi:hypothetical protein
MNGSLPKEGIISEVRFAVSLQADLDSSCRYEAVRKG